VIKNIGNEQVVFYDTRSSAEFTGQDLRGNKRGGHVPGAVLCNFEDLLDADKKTLPPQQVRNILKQKGITPDKQIVLYCQTATRVSLPLLALRDLGYTNVSIYDASWHEYGNRPDTPVESESTAEAR
jgi:thiosulfate/3-mercaptopyruvate sulfurtransferase